MELSLHTSSFIPRKTLFDFFSIPRLKSGPKKEFFSRKFSNRPPFHWNYVPYIFKKIFREFLQPPLPLIGTFSLFSYLFFLDCVPYVFYKVVLKTLIDIVPLTQSYVFFCAWKWLFAETLDNYCKKFAGPGLVFWGGGERPLKKQSYYCVLHKWREGANILLNGC